MGTICDDYRLDNTYYLFVLGHKNRKNIDENKNKRLKLASYFALAKINTVLKINTAPISSIEEKLTYSPCLNAGDSWIQTILAY